MQMTNPWALGTEDKPNWQRTRHSFLKLSLPGAKSHFDWCRQQTYSTKKKKSIEAVFTLNRLVSGWAWWVEVQRFIQAELKLWVMAGLDLPAWQWKSHRTESSHLWAWTKSPATQQSGGMTSRQSSPLPSPQGGDWGSGPVWTDSPIKGRGGFNGLGESRQAQNVCPGTSKLLKRRQFHESATVSLNAPLCSYLPPAPPGSPTERQPLAKHRSIPATEAGLRSLPVTCPSCLVLRKW